jgi:hypothetical protein
VTPAVEAAYAELRAALEPGTYAGLVAGLDALAALGHDGDAHTTTGRPET